MTTTSEEDSDYVLHVNDLAYHSLERYTGCPTSQFQPYILLTNFTKYLRLFANRTKGHIYHGSIMSCCHSLNDRISMINYNIGSPNAALITHLLSFIKPTAVIMLGLCGGLRDNYKIGEYFNPIAAIRGEGTSNDYLPPQCPALSSFIIQKFITIELERQNLTYHSGVIHTTNMRFWEFNTKFKEMLVAERVQAIDMECATLFTVGFSCKVPVGALMLISDLPLKEKGIKTKELAATIFKRLAKSHLELGITVFHTMQTHESEGFHYQF
ncbi:AMP nucleosidase [Legionella beliardensis]|uniref:AMP nucleosidase n=1 Tax=Legionella beliardensis TaxID=91822 RepID=A0A378I4E8_9GAMM|nr:AMP nucleosidase [Legionella beliardensis]STX29620.1 AMP nucleosidase [Legionella beliardensis]